MASILHTDRITNVDSFLHRNNTKLILGLLFPGRDWVVVSVTL